MSEERSAGLLARIEELEAALVIANRSRAIFVFRLQHATSLTTIDDVLALLSECDMLAYQEQQQ